MRIFSIVIGIGFSMALTAHAGAKADEHYSTRGIPDCFGTNQPYPGKYVVMPSDADMREYGSSAQPWNNVFHFMKMELSRNHIALYHPNISQGRFAVAVQPATALFPSEQLAFRKVLGGALRKYRLSFSCATVARPAGK
jgi:hypothetical protein